MKKIVFGMELRWEKKSQLWVEILFSLKNCWKSYEWDFTIC